MCFLSAWPSFPMETRSSGKARTPCVDASFLVAAAAAAAIDTGSRLLVVMPSLRLLFLTLLLLLTVIAASSLIRRSSASKMLFCRLASCALCCEMVASAAEEGRGG